FDEFENLLFNGHALGHNILGDEESLARFTSQSGQSFVKRYYAPSNMAFFSMGRTNVSKIIRLADKWAGAVSRPVSVNRRQAPHLMPPQNKRIKKDTHQAHVLIGGRSYSMYDGKRIPLFLLNNLLGGPGMNSRLNVVLREKYGLVYNVESNTTAYVDTGFTAIYFGTDPKNTEKVIRLIHKELKKIREEGLSSAQLAAAKKQLSGQLGISSDHKESLFLGAGKSFLHYNQYDTLPEVFRKIEKVSAMDILEVANEVFSPDTLSSLIYE
ncbi:MAG: insulinase family protein, partial [Tannerellaceae bacterium]|nr:insulinase family protein [Tannerellaceae bacterium]